jgi:DNA repair protein RecO (recombination protein O)
MLITTNGLVIRSYPSGNSDRVIHILTEDRGRLSVMVKGGSSKKAGAADPCTQLFTYGNFELYLGKGGDLYWFRGGSVLRSFYDLTTDLTHMALAAYLCDVADDFTPEETAEEETALLLKMLLNSLYVLDNGQKPPTLVKAVFELRSAALMGYCPDLSGCSLCGEPYPENAYLDVMNGRLICADCQTKRNRLVGAEKSDEATGARSIICPVSASVLAALRYVLTAPDKKIFSFSMKDSEEERSLERATETFLLNQLERDFDTLHFYRSVADLPSP